MAASTAANSVNKRLIVACDGAWMNLDRAWQGISWIPTCLGGGPPESLVTVPSNVTRICRSIAHEGTGGIPQIIYYSAGVGSDGSAYGHFFGGLTGNGVDEHIREAYGFIQANWNEGDEIVLIGYSRGAFTARSISAFLSAVGVLTRAGMEEFQNIFQDWECQLFDKYKGHWPADIPFEKRPTFRDNSYREELERRGMTRLDVAIKAVAVWDTVGALGIPDIGPFTFHKRLAFINNEVSSSVECAFQALALDEERRPFLPTMWERPNNSTRFRTLQQCWFPGVHGNIGSGYLDTGIADLTLAWMIHQLAAWDVITFLPESAIKERVFALQPLAPDIQPLSPKRWSLGKLYNSMSAFFWLAGRATRTPGRDCRPDPKTGVRTPRRLIGTNESIHPSVRIRMALGGGGVGASPAYKPKALKGWKVVEAEHNGEWRFVWRSDINGDPIEIPEATLEGIELELLKCSPGVYKMYIDSMRNVT